jgi:predicted ATPase
MTNAIHAASTEPIPVAPDLKWTHSFAALGPDF